MGRIIAAVVLFAGGCHRLDDSAGVIEHPLRWHQEPNTEIQDCHVFKLDNADPIEVSRIRIKFPPGSHHVHMYRADSPEADAVADCWSGIDWTRWHLVLGAQTQAMDWRLPDGLTVPLDPHQQLLVQVHWLNTTDRPIDGAIDLEFHTAARSDAHVGVVFGINKQTAMEPHERKVIRQWCQMPPDVHLLAMMGHFHGLGQSYQVRARREAELAGGETVYEALGEQTFQFKSYDPPYTLAPGVGLEFDCDFFNYRDIPIIWSADVKRGEHCNMSAYFYPADELSQFCMVEKAEVAAIDAMTPHALPNDRVTYAITLTEDAPAGGAAIQLAASNPTALDVPPVLTIPGGRRTGTVEARALAPGRVELTATLGTTSMTVESSIGGLVLSEVHAGEAGATDGRQWVEIANLSDVPIDLSRYSLGAGDRDYTAVRTTLTGIVAARGCVVIGGPEATVAGQPPYDQVHDFEPDFGLGATGGYGVALFDVPSTAIAPATLPYDALVYGDDNDALRGPDGQLVRAIARPPRGGTYFRASETLWATQTVATPRVCEVR